MDIFNKAIVDRLYEISSSAKGMKWFGKDFELDYWREAAFTTEQDGRIY